MHRVPDCCLIDLIMDTQDTPDEARKDESNGLSALSSEGKMSVHNLSIHHQCSASTTPPLIYHNVHCYHLLFQPSKISEALLHIFQQTYGHCV